MLFNSFQFAIFFIAVLALYHGVPRESRNGVLLAASLVFYSLWVPVYLVLLLGVVGVNYALIQWMARSPGARTPMILSCAFTLSVLGWFKYAAMIVETLLPWIEPIASGGDTAFQLPEIFIPLGISFYSFQIIALSVDTWRGSIAPIHSFRRYLLFVSFFPQLIAGPILRGHEFLPQLERGGVQTTERTRRGLWLVAVGLAKKVVMADFLLSPFVDEVYQASALPDAAFMWIGAYSFVFQVYFDFSGYSDMARGMALLLGFELPMNFEEPFLARSPAEFWRRWHITLSRWLSDYLYVPLGGNRRGSTRTLVNVMATMLLGGLWHGANWTYVLWGGLMGVFLVLHRVLERKRLDPERPLAWRDIPKIAVVFHMFVIAMVLFRSEDFAQAGRHLGIMFGFESPMGWPVLQTIIVLLSYTLHVAERYLRLRAPELRERLWSSPLAAGFEGVVLGCIVGVCVMVSGVGGDFIYFQF